MKKQINKIASIAFAFALLLTLIPAGFALDADDVVITTSVESAISITSSGDVTLVVNPALELPTDATTDDLDGSANPGNSLFLTSNEPDGFNVRVNLTSAALNSPNDLDSNIPGRSSNLTIAGITVSALEPGVAGDSQAVNLISTAGLGTSACDLTSGTSGTPIIEVTCDAGTHAMGDIVISGSEDGEGVGTTYAVIIGNTTFDTVEWATSNEATATAIAANIAESNLYLAWAASNVITVTDVVGGTAGNVDITVNIVQNGDGGGTAGEENLIGGLDDGATYDTFKAAVATQDVWFSVSGENSNFIPIVAGGSPVFLSGGYDGGDVLFATEGGTIEYMATEVDGLTGGYFNDTGADEGYIPYEANKVFYINNANVLNANLFIDHKATAIITTAIGPFSGTAIFTITANAL